jgi:bidirectional [NiFe] hydrogenase diaphorase subunit
MALARKNPNPPSDDKRWRIVGATMRRHGHQAHALIETLHSVQDCFGYLDGEALRYVANSLRVPVSQVYGVATFYHFFNLTPQGKHACVICTGTACYIKGAPDLLKALDETWNVRPGETTEDGQLSILTARCVGSCGAAPVAVLDGEVMGNVTPMILLERIQRLDDDAS